MHLVAPERRAARALGERVHGLRPSALDNVLHVIQGDIDAVIETARQALGQRAAIVLVTEAGGRYTDPEGGTRPDLSPCRFTNGRVDAALDAFLAG